MIENNIAFIANYCWKNAIDNMNEILSTEQIKNFSINDYYYLTVIQQLGTPNFGEIAEELHLTKPAVSAMIQRLMKNDLVTKEQSGTDRRVFYAKLTQKGLQIIQGDLIFYRHLAEGVLENLNSKQRIEVEQLMERMTEILKGRD